MKEGINHFYVTNKRLMQKEASKEEFTRRFSADVMRLGVGGMEAAMKLQKRDYT